MSNLKNLNDINKDAESFYSNYNNKNNWRLNYHIEPPFGLLNDPNGLAYFNDEYYIFYQWNPYGCEHKHKHWALVKTKDFINYTVPKAVLAPDKWYDKNGCYSGSGIVVNDKLELFYTGNVKDENGNRESYQCRITVDKEDNIVKKGAVVDNLPKGYTAHFRDPKIFKRDNKYYFVLGAQTENLLGRVLLYSSENLEDWNLEGEIKTDYENFGYMWECPSLFNLNGKDVLVFSPQGLEHEEFRYQNIYQSGYIVGSLNFKTLEFKHENFVELDMGKDFYAPQVFEDNKGRTIMIGWMGLPEEEENYPTKEMGWIHCLTMPRELTLKNNKLYQNPIDEFKNFRKSLLEKERNVICNNWKTNKISNNSYELILDIDNIDSSKIELRFIEGEDEYSSLVFDLESNIGFLDNRKLVNGIKSIRKFKFNDKKVKIHMFMDKSAVEIYLQDGEKVLSSRVYPKDNSFGLSLLCDRNIKINELELWSLGEMKYE